MPKSDKPDNTLSKDKLIKALQNLYSDRDKLADCIVHLTSEIEEVKLILVNLLKYQKELNDFENKVFKKNLEN